MIDAIKLIKDEIILHTNDDVKVTVVFDYYSHCFQITLMSQFLVTRYINQKIFYETMLKGKHSYTIEEMADNNPFALAILTIVNTKQPNNPIPHRQEYILNDYAKEILAKMVPAVFKKESNHAS